MFTDFTDQANSKYIENILKLFETSSDSDKLQFHSLRISEENVNTITDTLLKTDREPLRLY